MIITEFFILHVEVILCLHFHFQLIYLRSTTKFRSLEVTMLSQLIECGNRFMMNSEDIKEAQVLLLVQGDIMKGMFLY